jgi:predicted Zn-dependent peptidase
LAVGVSEEELGRARTVLKTALVFSGETPFRRLMQVMENWISRRRLLSLEEQVAEIAAVTADSIVRVLRKGPPGARPAVAAVGPLARLGI